MRLEVKKKSLADAVSSVSTLLASVSSEPQASVYLAATKPGTSLVVRAAAGQRLIETTVSGVTVQEPGRVALDLTRLQAALSVTGDVFQLNTSDTEANFVCKKVKGTLSVQPGVEFGIDTLSPNPDILVRNFKQMLRAVALKPEGRAADRTLHLEGTQLRMETTDSSRAIIAVQPTEEGAKRTFSFNLPAKALDALSAVLDGDGDVFIGIEDKFFTLRTTGLRLSLPRSSTSALQLTDQLTGWLKQMKSFGQVKVAVSEMSGALKDAVALTTAEPVAIVFDPARLHFKNVDSDPSPAEVDFDATVDFTESVTVVVDAKHLAECLKFYRPDDTVTIDLYDSAMIFNVDTSDVGLATQTTVMPYRETLKPTPPPKAKGAKKAKAAVIAPVPVPTDDDEDPAPAQPTAKAAPAPLAEPEPEPEPEVTKPARKAPTKKVAPPPPPVEDEAGPEDEDDEVFDEEA